MSSELATALVLLLYAVGLAPAVWLAWRPDSVRWLGVLYGTAIVGLAFYQTGIFSAGSLASTDVTHLVRADTPENRCQQVFAVLSENGVLLEQPSRDGLVVRGAAWDQLPQPVREAVTACAQSTLSIESPDGIVVIRR